MNKPKKVKFCSGNEIVLDLDKVSCVKFKENSIDLYISSHAFTISKADMDEKEWDKHRAELVKEFATK